MGNSSPWRSSALWAVGVSVAGSAVWLAGWLFGSSTLGATPAIIALLTWTCYAVLLTAAVARLARNAQTPAWAVVSAALWGGLAAAVLARLVASATRGEITSALGSADAAWESAVAAPLPEEFFKAVGVLLLMLAATPVIRGPLFGMALGAIVGIAFNAAEGLAYSVTEISDAGGYLDRLWSDLLIRGFLTGLVTHAGLTAIVGAGIGYLFGAKAADRVRRVSIVVGLLFSALILHLLIDSPLLDGWGVVGIIVKQIPVAVAVWYVLGRARSEQTRVRRQMRLG